MKYWVHLKWLVAVSLSVFVMMLIAEKVGLSQLKRDEETAKEAQKINPLSPAAKVTGAVLDNTVNRVLPFDLSTESQYVKYEAECYQGCERNKDAALQKAASDFDRGRIWTEFNKCKENCPKEAAQRTETKTRAPAGSALDQLKSR